MARKNLIAHSKKKQAKALFLADKLIKAKELYTKICKTDKRDADTWVMLGIINARLGVFTEAEACFHTAIRIQPDFVKAYYCMGNAFSKCGKIQEAVAYYQKTIQLNPDFYLAHYELGCILKQLGNLQGTLEIFQQALRIRSDSVQVLCHIGDLLLHMNKPDEALQYIKSAIRLKPDCFDAYCIQGNILRHQGRYNDALESYQSGLKIRPQDEQVSAEIAGIMETRGEFEEAYKLLRPFIESRSLYPSILRAYSRISRHIGHSESAIILMEQAVVVGSISTFEQIDLHYELGKRYDELTKFDKAFKHYRQANEASRTLNREITRQYDPNRWGNDIDRWIKEGNAEFWAHLPRSTNRSERPIFIIGMPRSGTSLAEQILASHPEVTGAGELDEIGQISRSLPVMLGTDLGYPRCLEAATNDTLDAMANRYLDRLAEFSRDAPRIVDKMPINFAHLGLISILFPKARVVHMTRNPLDACLSMYFQNFGASLVYTTDLTYLGTHYREYQKLMRHWKSVLDIPVLEIQYEELANNQEKTSRKMVEFCGLTWDTRCLSFHETKRDVNTPSYHQVRRPMYTTSIDRWKHYERYIDPLIKALR